MTKTVEFTYRGFPSSAVISNIWWNFKTKELYVKFHRNGTFAGYANVSSEEVNALLEADSVGAYYNQVFRDSKEYPGINTEGFNDDTFVSAYDATGALKNSFVSTSWQDYTPAPTFSPEPVTRRITVPASGQTAYVVKATVLRPVEIEEVVYATGLVDALTKFSQENEGSSVTGISVK